MSYFSVNLKKIRRKKGISQTEFAKIFGLTRAAVGAYEEGRAEPKLDKLLEIARYFGLSLDELISSEVFLDKENIQKKIIELNSEKVIPFVPLSDKKKYINSLLEEKNFEYKSIIIPGLVADIALEIEELFSLKNVIVFCRNSLRRRENKLMIGITRKEYLIFYGNKNFDHLIKFWNVCCLLTKDLDTLNYTDVRLERIEAKIDLLINTVKK